LPRMGRQKRHAHHNVPEEEEDEITVVREKIGRIEAEMNTIQGEKAKNWHIV